MQLFLFAYAFLAFFFFFAFMNKYFYNNRNLYAKVNDLIRLALCLETVYIPMWFWSIIFIFCCICANSCLIIYKIILCHCGFNVVSIFSIAMRTEKVNFYWNKLSCFSSFPRSVESPVGSRPQIHIQKKLINERYSCFLSINYFFRMNFQE